MSFGSPREVDGAAARVLIVAAVVGADREGQCVSTAHRVVRCRGRPQGELEVALGNGMTVLVEVSPGDLPARLGSQGVQPAADLLGVPARTRELAASGRSEIAASEFIVEVAQMVETFVGVTDQLGRDLPGTGRDQRTVVLSADGQLLATT